MKVMGNGMVFKINLKKAYNCVDCDLLWFVMYKMGFGERWVRWIKRCLSLGAGQWFGW